MSNDDLLRQSEETLLANIKANPDDVAIRLEYAYFLSGRQRLDEAEAIFEAAYEIAGGNPDVVSMYSRFLVSRGKFEDAETIVAEALKNNPIEAILLRSHGYVLFSIGDFEAAIDEFNSARDLSGDDPSIDYQIVECLIAGGLYIEAVEQSKEFCEQYPQCATRLHSHGRALWASENLEQAETVLKKALEIAERSLNILLDLSGVLNDMESFDLAIELMLKNEEMFASSAEFHYVLGNLYADAIQLDKARMTYMKALAHNPHHYHALNNLALLLQEKKAPDEEVEDLFRRALDANPDDTLANYNYGNFLIGNGRREEAIPHYRKVMDNDPWYLQAHISYAQTLLELGNKSRALAELQEAARSDDATSEDLAKIAKLYIQADYEEEGERLLLHAIRDSSDTAFFPLEYLGDFYFERGRQLESVIAYIRAILIDPADTAIWIKAVGTMLDNRTRAGFIEGVETFLIEELPKVYDRSHEDELVGVFLMLTEDLLSGGVKRLSTFGEAAWKLRQPALLAVYASMMAEFGEDEDASQAFIASLQEAPADVALVREYVGFLIRRKEHETARSVVLEAKKHVPDEPMLENDLGLVEFSLGNSRDAESIFFNLSRRYPLEATYIYNYAWVLYNRGMSEMAIQILDKYIESVSFDEECAYFAAQILAEQRNKGEFGKAEKYLRKVISLNPEHFSAWTLLGWIKEECGEIQNARYAYNNAMEIAPENMKVLLSAAGFALSTLQLSTAAKILATAEKLEPDNEDLLLEQARLHQSTGKYSESTKQLFRLYNLEPARYAFSLACTLHYLGRVSEAEAIALPYLDAPTTKSTSTAKSWYLFQTGNAEKAIEEIVTGMREYTEITDFRNLSLFLLASGLLQEANDSHHIFMENVVSALDVHFYLEDLVDYASRFPDEQRALIASQLSGKLAQMRRRIEAANGIA